MNGNQKRNRINAEKFGLWECCGGIWYTASGRCPKCGKTAADRDRAAGSKDPKPESTEVNALDKVVQTAKGIFPASARLEVTIVRGSGPIPLDHDNLVGGCKPLRDAIAELLGRDDAERNGIEWVYKQERGAASGSNSSQRITGRRSKTLNQSGMLLVQTTFYRRT